ncbi:MAG: hypothetical protein V3V55_05250 [Rhodospirillales bacterium]
MVLAGLGDKASVLVSGVIGIMLLFHLVQQPRPESGPRAVADLPAPSAAGRRQEDKTSLAVAAVSLPPPPALAAKPKPRKDAAAPGKAVNALKPERTVPKPAVNPMPPKVKQERTAIERLEPLRPGKGKQPLKPVEASRKAPVAVRVKTIRAAAANGPMAMAGRPLLRLLEHGQGPEIEIVWPSERRSREALYRLLGNCHGMLAAVMDGDGNLYLAEGQRRRRWELDLDRFSGFVRQPAGFTARQEDRQADAIRRHHGLGRSARLVRLFPRRVDAALLGGLREILGERYKTAAAIRAAYRQAGPRLFIENIEADGVRVDGRIALASVAAPGCRQSGVGR